MIFRTRRGRLLAAAVALTTAVAITQWPDDGVGRSARAQDTTIWIEDAFPGLTFARPVFVTQAPDDSPVMYVVEQRGRIQEVHPAPAPPIAASKALFLDLSDRVSPSGNERGLFAIAFHPDFATNGRYFVHYTRRGDGATVLSELGLREDGPTRGDPGSERILLTRSQPASNHNGGMLAFGPDGMLYLGLGDGGGGGDPWEEGQDLTSWLGAILRIDVDGRDPGKEYAVPTDNPFLDTPGALPEIWAYGLRNPWRFSFDRQTGELWCGDVGQSKWEEISVVPRGGNMGWDRKEGFAEFEPESGDPLVPFTDPLVVHRHVQNGGDAASITGGYVYRGTEIDYLQGKYVYADYAGGWINIITRSGPNATTTRLLSPGESITSFGEDRAGELYICSFSSGGRVLRLHGTGDDPPPTEPDTLPPTLSVTGLFSDLPALTPVVGARRYGVRAPLWSDGAEKERFVVLPPGTAMGWRAEDAFDLPVGAVAVKTFSLPLDRKREQRLETRVIRRTHDGFLMGAYRWRSDLTDADLVTNAATETVTGREGTFTWTYPSPENCLSCHTETAGIWLGLRARQLRHHRRPRDLVRRWHRDGVLFGAVPNRREIEVNLPLRGKGRRAARARSYLDANCSSCHRPEAPQPAGLDLRASTPLESAGILDTPPTRGEHGIADARLIAPGEPDRSVLLVRTALRGDEKQMPQLGSDVPDERALRTLRRWIKRLR